MPGGTHTAPGKNVVQDYVALAEIELCGELMIAASAAETAGEERLSVARIDEVLGAAGVRLEESAPPARRT